MPEALNFYILPLPVCSFSDNQTCNDQDNIFAKLYILSWEKIFLERNVISEIECKIIYQIYDGIGLNSNFFQIKSIIVNEIIFAIFAIFEFLFFQINSIIVYEI